MAMSLEQARAGPTQKKDQRRVGIIFGGLMLALLISSLDQTVVAMALPTIVSDLGGLSQLSWVVTAYLLISTVSTPAIRPNETCWCNWPGYGRFGGQRYPVVFALATGRAMPRCRTGCPFNPSAPTASICSWDYSGQASLS